MEMLGSFSVFSLAVVVLAIVIVTKAVKIVPQSEKWTVERFGRYTETLTPGLSFIVPFIDRVNYRLSLREQVLDIQGQEVITRDNASIRADGVVFFQIMDAERAAYQVEDLQLAITNLTMTNIRSVLGSMDLDDTLSSRDQINERLLRVVNEACDPWGVRITRVELKDISPPADLVVAMNQQMQAEREKRAAILRADGEREAEIKLAEGEKQSAILKAEGELRAAQLEAEARERLAQAEANATREVSQAIAEGNLNAVNYFIAQKYVEALREIGVAPSSKLVLMPLDASGVVGSVAGIAELIQNVSKPQGGAK